MAAREGGPSRVHSQTVELIPGFLTASELAIVRKVCDETVTELHLQDQMAGMDGADPVATRGCIYQTWQDPRAVVESACLSPDPCRVHSLTSQVGFCPEALEPLTEGYANVLFGQRMRSLVERVLGTQECFLFNDQFIVKPPNAQFSSFPWHKDSDWCRERADVMHSPYISVWIPLDDITEENGALQVQLPNKALFLPTPSGIDEDRGTVQALVLAPLSAGTAVIMGDGVQHCSSPNTSTRPRRVWMPQFSTNPIIYVTGPNAGQPLSLAVLMHCP